MMDTQVLEYLIAIADEGNISRAAERFYLSQPVISRHLKRAEEEAGAPLFIRAHNEMRLTDEGRIYINTARAILYAEKELERDLEQLRYESRKKLRVLVDPYLKRYLKRVIQPRFEESWPTYELSVSTGDLESAKAALRHDLADAAILSVQPEEIRSIEDSLHAELLFSDQMVVVVPQAWYTAELAEQVARLGPHALQERCFLMEKTNQSLRRVEMAALERYSFQPRLRCDVGGSTAILRMVRNGQGVALIPLSLAQACLAEVAVCPLNPPVSLNLYALFPGSRPLRKGEQGLLQFLIEGYGIWDKYLQEINSDNN